MRNTCPSTDRLGEWLAGILLNDAAQTVYDHVIDCETCESTIEQLEAEMPAPLMALGRPEPEDCVVEEQPLARAIKNIVHLAFDVEPNRQRLPYKQIGCYELLQFVGSGGMGDVYAARHLELDRDVAIKLLPSHRLHSQKHIERFRRERRALARLDHPNIVRALDAGNHGGVEYLVMEFIDGVDVGCIQNQVGRLSIPDACEIIRQAALGLQFAHEQGLVHRDIKPTNLIVDRAGVVKILDLGLVTSSDSEASELTDTGQLMGSIDYMAPEQGNSSQTLDIRADIFSLGATLFKLVNDEPLLGNHATAYTKLTALLAEPIPSIGVHRDDLPPDLIAIVRRMLDRDPEGRFKVPDEVAQAISPFCAGADLKELVGAHPDNCATTSTISNTSTFVDDDSIVGTVHKDQHRDTAKKSNSIRTAWITAVAFATLSILAVVINLNTDGGNILVECHDENLQLEVIRNKKSIGQWAAGQLADYTWFRSGEYEIRIPRNEQDRFVIKKNKFKLTRNKRRIVTIERRQSESDKFGVTDKQWLDRSFRLNGIDDHGAPTRFFAIDGDGNFSLSAKDTDRWRLLPCLDGWLIQHVETLRVVAAKSVGEIELQQYDGSLAQHWIRKKVTLGKPFWALQNADNQAWMSCSDRVQLVHANKVFHEGKTHFHGAIDFNPKFEPLTPELHSVWDFDTTGIVDAGRSIDILTSDDWRWTDPEPLGKDVNDGLLTTAYPSLTPDGLTIMFAREQNVFRTFLASRKSLNDEFKVSHELVLPAGLCYGMSLARFAPEMLYCSFNSPDGVGFAQTNLYSRRLSKQGEWHATDLFSKINSEYKDDTPALTADGKTAYFSSWRPGGQGKCDLWKATRQSLDVPFETPVPLEHKMNSPDVELSPTLSYDSLSLVFVSNRLNDGNGSVLWIATRNSVDEPFANPQLLRIPVQPGAKVRDPALALNGRLLVFKQPNDDGVLQLYATRRVPKAERQKHVTISPPALADSPFSADAAHESQKSWAAHLGVPMEVSNRVGMRMVLIPPGEFTMGASQQEIDQMFDNARNPLKAATRIESTGPSHRVRLTRPYWLGVNELTRGQYAKLMADSSNNPADQHDYPVTGINWLDAIAFCNALSRHEKLVPYYEIDDENVTTTGSDGYRLPTEAEWEFACRAGSQSAWWFGNDKSELGHHAWYDENSKGRPHQVGELTANPFGIHDIHGNVWERCEDSHYKYEGRSITVDPTHLENNVRRIVRGGGATYPADHLRSAFRHFQSPEYRSTNTGLRLARTCVADR